MTSNFIEELIDYHVIDCHLNFSDHLPIAIVLTYSDKLMINDKSTDNSITKHEPTVVKNLRWDHGDKLGYYEMTRQALIDVDDRLTALTQLHSDYPTHDIES